VYNAEPDLGIPEAPSAVSRGLLSGMSVHVRPSSKEVYTRRPKARMQPSTNLFLHTQLQPSLMGVGGVEGGATMDGGNVALN